MGKKRYFEDVDMGDVVEFRPCIINRKTEERRLELQIEFRNGEVWGPTLIEVTDRCSTGQPLDLFLGNGLLMRKVHFYDPWHIIEGILNKCFDDTGRRVLRVESAVAMNAFRRPVAQCGFLAEFRWLC